MQVKTPRVLLAAASSGGGKTTITCGLLQALVNRGLDARACKCGPDYIDPMFHRTVIGAPSRNLDLFFAGADLVRAQVAEGANADITVIEGVMGYYDGIATSTEGSAWAVADATQTPVVLVIDGHARSMSVAAEVMGFAQFRQPSHVQGVILNRISPAMYDRIKALIEDECGVRCFGYVPQIDDVGLESRHLGLVTADEVPHLHEKLMQLAGVLEDSVDIDGLIELARSAPAIDFEPPAVPAPVEGAPVIAVAKDDAFCFYYDDTLDLLCRLGARLVEFSPLADACVPPEASGLYLGGGYPELHAAELAANTSMLESIRACLQAEMPTIAECGGFMYLHEEIEDESGARHALVGRIEGAAYRTPRLRRFGYVTLTAKEAGLLADVGDELRAHEFHYWDSTNCGKAFHAQKPLSARGWECGITTPAFYAGYPHLYLPSNPQAARRFVAACAAYAQAQGGARS